jgi:HAD superfamily hydrolase (TIGR01509 family)
MTRAGAPDPTGCAYDLVVFDCDGVLVDSERLAVRVEAEVLAELGWPLTEAEVVDRFVGRSASYMQAEVERELGREIDWDATFAPRHRAAYDAELEAVPGVAAVVDALCAAGVPRCVASSSTHASIEFKLRRTGLWDAFAGAIFSVDDVAHSKPAPDVFLHAARELGATPMACAVVEDSTTGVAAGLAAGMEVFAFSGGVTGADQLAAPGATVFDDMTQLGALLARPRAVRDDSTHRP